MSLVIPSLGRLLLAVTAAVLAGCAIQPPISAAPLSSPAPYYAAEHFERFRGSEVLWGGTIIDLRNFERYSELEIVAFPLDSQQRPLFEAAEQGRFVAIRAGFLDPAEFSPGRFITVFGPITGDRELKLRGETARMSEVDARELLLWPRDYRFNRSNISIGIGIRAGF